MDTEDKFQKKCDQYKEFLVLYDRHPKNNGKGHNEHELSVFKKQQRVIYHSSTGMRPNREKMLDDVHPGILDHSLPYNYIHNKEPSDAWKEVFKNWADETTVEEVRAYTFPTIPDSYVPTAMSFKEHFIIKTGMHRHFEPNDCHPTKTAIGTMQHVVSYLLHPDHYKLNEIRQSSNNTAGFEKNVFEGEHPPAPHPLRHQYSGTLLPSKHTSSDIHSMTQRAYNELFPMGNMMQDIKVCTSLTEYAGVLKKYEHCIDTFNYANRGLNGEVENIIQLPQFQQPLRIGLSCTFEPPRYFPSLGVHCTKLFAYGAAGRPMIAGTCRPMGECCFLLGEMIWRTAIPHLTPLCRYGPPISCQVLTYTDLWLEDEEELLEEIKARQKKKSTAAATTKTNKNNNDNTQDEGNNMQTRSSKRSRLDEETCNKRPRPNNNKNGTQQNRSKKKHHKKGDMRPHHDNGRRDIVSGAHVGANPDKEVNSHIYGTDVLMITIGDKMEYHLIRASNQSKNSWVRQPEKMQDYTMSQDDAIHNLRDHQSRNKKSSLTLVKTVKLDEYSIYVHTAHDDEVYFHALNFAKELKKRNRVRVVFVYRWLAVSQYFRQNADDPNGNRYSMISKHGFEMLDKRDNDAESWWKAMHYIDSDGNNIIKNLMGPFPPKKKK